MTDWRGNGIVYRLIEGFSIKEILVYDNKFSCFVGLHKGLLKEKRKGKGNWISFNLENGENIC